MISKESFAQKLEYCLGDTVSLKGVIPHAKQDSIAIIEWYKQPEVTDVSLVNKKTHTLSDNKIYKIADSTENTYDTIPKILLKFNDTIQGSNTTSTFITPWGIQNTMIDKGDTLWISGGVKQEKKYWDNSKTIMYSPPPYDTWYIWLDFLQHLSKQGKRELQKTNNVFDEYWESKKIHTHTSETDINKIKTDYANKGLLITDDSFVFVVGGDRITFSYLPFTVDKQGNKYFIFRVEYLQSTHFNNYEIDIIKRHHYKVFEESESCIIKITANKDSIYVFSAIEGIPSSLWHTLPGTNVHQRTLTVSKQNELLIPNGAYGVLEKISLDKLSPNYGIRQIIAGNRISKPNNFENTPSSLPIPRAATTDLRGNIYVYSHSSDVQNIKKFPAISTSGTPGEEFATSTSNIFSPGIDIDVLGRLFFQSPETITLQGMMRTNRYSLSYDPKEDFLFKKQYFTGSIKIDKYGNIIIANVNNISRHDFKQVDSLDYTPKKSGKYRIKVFYVNGDSLESNTFQVFEPPKVALRSKTSCISFGTEIELYAESDSILTYSWKDIPTLTDSFRNIILDKDSTFTVYGTDIRGCTDTADYNIKIAIPPSIAIHINPSDTVCTDDIVTLNIQSDNQNRRFTWKDEYNNILSPLASYTLTAKKTKHYYAEVHDTATSCKSYLDTTLYVKNVGDATLFSNIPKNDLLKLCPNQKVSFGITMIQKKELSTTIPKPYHWYIKTGSKLWDSLTATPLITYDNFYKDTSIIYCVITDNCGSSISSDTLHAVQNNILETALLKINIQGNKQYCLTENNKHILIENEALDLIQGEPMQWHINNQVINGNVGQSINYTIPDYTKKDTIKIYANISLNVCGVKKDILSNIEYIYIQDSIKPLLDIEVTNAYLCPKEGVEVKLVKHENMGVDKSGKYIYTWIIEEKKTNSIISQIQTHYQPLFYSKTLPIGEYRVYLKGESNISCAISEGIVYSDTIDFEVAENFEGRIDIENLTGKICRGGVATFLATAHKVENNPYYIWEVNDNIVTKGRGERVFQSTKLKNGDRVRVLIKSHSDCYQERLQGSKYLEVEVYEEDQPKAVVISSSQTFCQGGKTLNLEVYDSKNKLAKNHAYQWFKNGKHISTNRFLYLKNVKQNDYFMGVVTNTIGCSDTSAKIKADILATRLLTQHETQLPEDMPSRFGAMSFSFGSAGYIMMGEDGIKTYNDVWRYIPLLGVWTQMASFPDTIGRSMGVVIQNDSLAHVGLGYSKYTSSMLGSDYSSHADFYTYDPSTNIWKQQSDSSYIKSGGTERYGSVTFRIGDSSYIFGGTDDRIFYNDLYLYSHTYNTWKQIHSSSTYRDNYPKGRRNAIAMSKGRRAYLGLGYNGNDKQTLQDIWSYDPNTRTFSQKEDFPGEARELAIGFNMNDRLYIGYGRKIKENVDDNGQNSKPYQNENSFELIFNDLFNGLNQEEILTNLTSTEEQSWGDVWELIETKKDDGQYKISWKNYGTLGDIPESYSLVSMNIDNEQYIGMGMKNELNEFIDNDSRRTLWKVSSEYIEILPCIQTLPLVDTYFCLQDSIEIAFKYAYPFNKDNVFTIELSDGEGNFIQNIPNDLANIYSHNDNMLKIKIHKNDIKKKYVEDNNIHPELYNIITHNRLHKKHKYKFRVRSSSPISDSLFPGEIMAHIYEYKKPKILIEPETWGSTDTNKKYCEGDILLYKVVDKVNAGYKDSIEYTWKRNGQIVKHSKGEAGETFKYHIYNSLDSIYCEMVNKTDVCITHNPTISNVLSISLMKWEDEVIRKGNILEVKHNTEQQQQGTTYTWENCSTKEILQSGSLDKVKVDKEGIIRVVKKDNRGCEVKSKCMIIDDIAGELYITAVYPVPSNGPVTILLSNTYKEMDMKIYTMDGEEIMQQSYNEIIPKKSIELDISHLPIGAYIVVLISKEHDKILNAKIIKQ